MKTFLKVNISQQVTFLAISHLCNFYFVYICKMHVRGKYEDDRVISTCESLERIILCDAVKLTVIIVMQKQCLI